MTSHNAAKITAQMIADSLTTAECSSGNAVASKPTFDQNDALAMLVLQQQSMLKILKKMNKEQQQIEQEQAQNWRTSCWAGTRAVLDQLVTMMHFVSCNSSIFSFENTEIDLEDGRGNFLSASNY